MNTLYHEMKDQFRKRDNAVMKLIIINVIIYLVDLILEVTSVISKTGFYDTLLQWQAMPGNIHEFLYKPWTLISYFFVHSTPWPWHIFGNMLAMYLFGSVIQEMIGSRRVISLYVLGGLAGGLLYLLLSNTVPYFIEYNNSLLLGASGSVFAIAVAAATLVPHYTFNILFFGPIRIIYIVAFYIVLSVALTIGGNPGGGLAHIGGALLGYIFIVLLRKGTDIGRPVSRVMDIINGRSHLKVSFRRKGKVDENYAPNEAEIDIILDKINRSGYESLTKDEKMKLFKASQK